MNKSIKALIALGINLFLFLSIVQCNTEQKEVKILYLKNTSYYSFFLETPTSIFYSTPNSSELKSKTSENKKEIIFEDELKKFKSYNLPSGKKEFDNIFISNKLGETNFENNHLFEYDIQMNRNGKVKANIYYPEDMIGSYEFGIDDLTKDMISKSLNGLSPQKARNNENINNVIIVQDKKNIEVFKGDYYISNSPEYSLILALTNKFLLEQMNKNHKKIEKFDTPANNYIEHTPLPPPPPTLK